MRRLFQCKGKPDGATNMVPYFITNKILGLGWGETGSLKGVDKEGIREALIKLGYAEGSLRTNLGTLNCLVNTIQTNDVVMLPDGDLVQIGISGEYDYWNQDGWQMHVRNVEWVALNVRRNDLNAEVQSLLRNPTSCTQFPHPIEVADLDRYLKGEQSPVSAGNNPLVKKALEIVEAEMNKGSLEAAIAILNYFK